MRRLLLLVTVAVVMAVMLMAMAAPAIASSETPKPNPTALCAVGAKGTLHPIIVHVSGEPGGLIFCVPPGQPS
jgi:hypothetical protein